MTAPKDEVYTGVYPKCIKDKGLCGVGGFCDVCPHVINNQDELSVEELIRWYANDDEVYGDAYPAYLEAVSRATISHLRRLQQMRAEIDAKDKILDQHIAALRSVAWAITDKACGGVDDIVAEAKRVRAELEACRKDAERYRWLVRNRHGWFYRMLSYHPMKPVCKDTFDEAIDKAISAWEDYGDE